MLPLIVKGLSRHKPFFLSLSAAECMEKGLTLLQKRKLNDLLWWNWLDAQQLRQLLPKGEGKHFIRSFSIETVSADTVDMREHQVYGILREPIEALPLWEDIPQERVVLFDPWLLGGTHGVTEKQVGLPGSIWCLLKGSNIGKLTTVIREKHRKHRAGFYPHAR